MTDEISKLKGDALLRIRDAQDESQLEELRIAFLGKKGSVSLKMRSLGNMSNDDKAKLGPVLNALKNDINQSISEKKRELRKQAIDERLKGEWIDVTQPSKEKKWGTIHPVSQVTDEVVAIFSV